MSINHFIDTQSMSQGNRSAGEEPERLKLLSRAALAPGRHHSSEEWYRWRAEWTQQVVARHKSNRRIL